MDGRLSVTGVSCNSKGMESGGKGMESGGSFSRLEEGAFAVAVGRGAACARGEGRGDGGEDEVRGGEEGSGLWIGERR